MTLIHAAGQMHVKGEVGDLPTHCTSAENTHTHNNTYVNYISIKGVRKEELY